MKYILDENYNVLDRLGHWDKETQQLIQQRLQKDSGLSQRFSFLTAQEGALLKQMIDVLLYQPGVGQKLPIAQAIDRQLSDRRAGNKYPDIPWRGEFYKKGLAELLKLKPAETDQTNGNDWLAAVIKQSLTEEKVDFLARFVRKVLFDAIEIFYSQPAAWNKIGFPGPAYPEGYAYLDCAEADEWEPKYEKKG